MSFTITTDTFCDGCNDWVDGISKTSPDRTYAWKNAEAHGWKRIKGNTRKGEKHKHYCSRCFEKLEKKEG